MSDVLVKQAFMTIREGRSAEWDYSQANAFDEKHRREIVSDHRSL